MTYTPWKTGFRIRNGSPIDSTHLQVSVTKTTNPGGHNTWFDLASDFADHTTSFWSRNGWETILVEHKQTGQRRVWHLNSADYVVEVVFPGFTTPAECGPGLWIRAGPTVVADQYQVFVSRWTNGKGSTYWQPLATDFTNFSASYWSRNGYETVTFKEKATGKQRAWQLNCKDIAIEVTFVGLEQELGVNRLAL